MRRTILSLLLALASVAHAEVRIVGAYPTDRSGVPVVPKVGEPFYLTVSLRATKGTPPFQVVIDTPSETLTTGSLTLQGDGWARRGEIVPLFDGPMDVTISCAAASSPFRLRIVPGSPRNVLETYRPQALRGSLGTAVLLNRPASRLLAWLPIPQSAFAQSVGAVEAPAWQAMSREGASVGLVEARSVPGVEASSAFELSSASVRSNLSSLRSVPMSAVTSRAWLARETGIESDHREVVAFAKAATKGMGKKTPVADVARALYQAVLRRSVYARTGRAPDALLTLRSGGGECGDLSALFVASCRSVGVPARPVSGFTLGVDAWHVWAEFFVPGRGWIPVDPAYALGRRPHASEPLYFGVIPEMRDRVALCNGFVHTVGSERAPFLQTPTVFAFGKGLALRSSKTWCRLAADVAIVP